MREPQHQDESAQLIRCLGEMLPPELGTIRLAGSGAAANELALRLAEARTGARDVIVIDHAWHGNSPSLTAISPYIFDAPGGMGRPAHVWVAEMPDSYRGRLRQGDKDVGAGYAESVATMVMDMVGLGRRPMALIAEGVQGTGGQIPLPPGYLPAAYRHVRREGGLTIADEVATGFGRIGTHPWAFEAQGVIPDIVTAELPLGPGRRLGIVAMQAEIAKAQAELAGIGIDPVLVSAGIAAFDEIRDGKQQAHAQERGQQLMTGLLALGARHPRIGDVRGSGLVLGVEFVKDRSTLQPDADAVSRLLPRLEGGGVPLTRTGQHRNVLAIRPPMTIDAATCVQFLSVLGAALTDLDL
ncbi:aminotransferase class III-fold pyridoxal phosphate-dependent enzyme [Dongia sp.]|uniref:aminotransferase class III-fold pyridoxal phosphate-dependent enzyme n=1 Tax=Dongia sp. TaxID=1977262 RepID=UPI0035ADDE54